MNCVHLDFHTSPDIDRIGEEFDREKLIRTIKEAKIDLMTVFAKCHHGYTYYPSRVSTMHPGLRFNLLEAELEAIRAAGAKAPIYITMGWSKKDADEHPEWRQISAVTGKPIVMGEIPDDLDAPLPHCSWETLCPSGGYMKHLEDITREVCESFDVRDGIFYDICFVNDHCVCESCKEQMKKRGLDPTSLTDARRYYVQMRIDVMKRLTSLVHSYAPDAPVFYNGGADMNRTEYHPYQTHYELEDLPTAWGGYDLMPLRAKFFERYGKPFLGMTGKFHHAWGEFGGFKNKDALKYECADMLSLGASTSVGDHLHPSGLIDDSAYRIIGHAFRYTASIEKYCIGTRAYSDLAIWTSHNSASDMGASQLLQVMHLEYDIVKTGDDLSGYRCIILPDCVSLTDTDKAALLAFTNRGGTLIASFDSAFAELGIEKLGEVEYDCDYIQCDIGDYTTPFLSYSKAMKVQAEGEILARNYEPYFSRTGRHFCGHKNTPNRLTPAEYPALIQRGSVLYFAHPVFSAYNKSGNYVLEQYIIYAIDRVYRRQVTVEGLPSTGRLRLRQSEDGEYFALHLLYAPPVNRGNVCLLPDFPTLHGVKVCLRTDKEIASVRTEPDGAPLAFTKTEDGIEFTAEPFSLHKLFIISYK